MREGLTGSSPVSSTIQKLAALAFGMAGHSLKNFHVVMEFSYTYVLRCADDYWYIGSTDNLRRRLAEHRAGKVTSTTNRRLLELVYYEACRSLAAARRRERELKTGFGRGYLNRRLAFEKISSIGQPAA